MAVYEYGEKPELTWGKSAALSVFVFAAILLTLFSWYETQTAGNPQQVFGTVVTWKNHAKDDALQPQRTVSIRLDEGRTVSAVVDGFVPLFAGARAELTETTTPTFGLKRYRLVQVAEAPQELPR